MEKKREVKALSIVALVVAVIGLTVAFAALSTTLTINGRAMVKSGTWEIKFENLSKEELKGAAKIDETSKPSIDDNGTKISEYSVILTKPGDSVSYTFDVHNKGSIDAKIGTFSKNEPECTSLASEKIDSDATMVCNHLVYTLKYFDNTNVVAQNDELDQGQTKKMRLTIGYDENAEEIPSDDVKITIPEISMIYVQK